MVRKGSSVAGGGGGPPAGWTPDEAGSAERPLMSTKHRRAKGRGRSLQAAMVLAGGRRKSKTHQCALKKNFFFSHIIRL